jgi:meiotically up-regulated gene 157 (Mug157) protein
MTTRKDFLRTGGLISAAVLLGAGKINARNFWSLETKRPPLADRKFRSEAIEQVIKQVKKGIKNEEMGWLFENCFPNTLDTTVDYSEKKGRPDTYVITGDIDAMWLRDSTAQVWPYLPLMKEDPALQKLVAGLINRQTQCILLDPYANSFYKDGSRVSEWKETDYTEMRPGVHERKWEIDSLCYPIRLAYGYWTSTGDARPFNKEWKEGIRLTLQTFREQQRKEDKGPYKFQRKTHWATDGVPIEGYGYPVKPNGLICSIFRPSDDATIYPYLIPSNFFAVVALNQAAIILRDVVKDNQLASECDSLSAEVKQALAANATVMDPRYGEVYAYEVNGFGSFNLMDDANVPSLLSLPYLGAIDSQDKVYQNTRRMLLSSHNPFYFAGKAAQGIGSPHTGIDLIWPMSITMRALTSHSDDEIRECLQLLRSTHGGTGFMHESFHKDDPTKFTRKWFAWANTLFGELVWKTYQQNPHLLT